MSTSPSPPPNPVQADLLAGRPVSFPAPTVPPPETPASRAARTIPAQWLQDLASPNSRKISVPILVTNAIIDGPLNLSYVTFDCAVEFSGCEFTGGAVDFSFSTFSRSAKFSACRFTFSPSIDPNDDAPVSFRALHASADLILAGSVFISKLDCSDIHVEEMLDASGADFAEVSFQRMVVAKSAYFSVDLQGARTVFGSDASFLGAQIGANAEFGGSLFSKKLTCDDIRIEGDAFFCTEQVEVGATLPGGRAPHRIEFHEEARFLGAHISGDAVFLGAYFHAKAGFDRLRVDGNAYFRKPPGTADPTVFEGEARFPLAVFSSGVQFNDAHFVQKADFRYAVFHSAAVFIHVEFGGELDFTSANGDSDLDFKNSKFATVATFREARFRVAFFAKPPEDKLPGRAGAPEYLMERTEFGGLVDFRGFAYERIYVDWRALCPRLTPFDRQPYNQLESAFRKAGADDLANGVYLLRRAVERKRHFIHRRYDLWLANWLYKIVANYGVRPWWILSWAFGTLLFGAWLFMQPNALEAKDPKRNDPPAPAASFPPALGVSFHQFLPVDVPVGDYWVPSHKAIQLSFYRLHMCVYPSLYSTIALRIFGTLLQALLVGQFTGVLRRAAP